MILSSLKYLFLLGIFALPFCANARPAVIDINATNENYTQIGTFIGQETQRMFPDIAKSYDDYLNFLLSQTQFQQLLSQVESLKDSIDSNYKLEIEAISSIWQLNTFDHLGDGKLSVNEFWLLQFLPDLVSINKGVAFATTNNLNKNPLVARNVDWKSTPNLRALQTVNVYRYQDKTLVSIGFAGLVGVINGFNNQGLFVSLLDSSEEQLSTAVSPIHSTVFDLRYALQNTEKITQANQILSSKFYPRSHQIIFADPQKIAILEQPAGKNGILRKTDSLIVNEMTLNNTEHLISVNCFVLKSSPHNCQASTDYYRWGHLAELLNPFLGRIITVKDAILLMQNTVNGNHAIFNNNTLQSIIFTPKDKTLYLYTQSIEQMFFSPPLIEKYQFIEKSQLEINNTLISISLLLGVGILAIAWWLIFNSNKIKKS